MMELELLKNCSKINRMSDKKGLLPLHLVFDRMISLNLSNLPLIVFQSKQPIQIESLSVTLKESYLNFPLNIPL